MSMMGRFVQVSPDRLKQLIDDPSGVEELFASEQAIQAMPKFMGALKGLQGRAPKMLAASMATMPPELRERLAQSLKNLGIDPDALARGEGGDDLAKLEIGDDLGYGPARYLEADEVAAIARELSRPNLEAEMTARFDPAQMANLGIYPGGFDAADKQWLMDAFQQLRQFYVDASAANLAVVTCIE